MATFLDRREQREEPTPPPTAPQRTDVPTFFSGFFTGLFAAAVIFMIWYIETRNTVSLNLN